MNDKIMIGNIELFRIVEYEGPVMKIFELFPEATNEIIDSHKHWMAPKFIDLDSKFLVLTMQSFLLKTPSRNILIDTCSGNLKNRKRPLMNQQNWPWIKTLSNAGTSPRDIDLVICTHLHVDHVGRNSRIG